jgi:hypothetical protein
LIDADDYPMALEIAVEHRVKMLYADLKGIAAPGVSLIGADLRGADLTNSILPAACLSRSDLRSAKLTRACLQEAVLRRTDLRGADLRRANFRDADLEGAQLLGADLRGTDIHGAKLDRALMDWRYATIPLELLRRDRQAHAKGLQTILELAFNSEDDSKARPYSWLKAIVRRPSEMDWSLSVLGQYLRPDDNAPELLRRLSADAGYIVPASVLRLPLASAALKPVKDMAWTSRDLEKPRFCGYGR